MAGCLEGECHYLTGNIRAKKRVNKLKKDLAQMGIEPERLDMFNLSSSEGPRFAAICKEMTDRAYFSWRHNLSPLAGRFRVIAPELPPQAPQEEAPAAVNKILIAFLTRSINN